MSQIRVPIADVVDILEDLVTEGKAMRTHKNCKESYGWNNVIQLYPAVVTKEEEEEEGAGNRV